MSKLIYVDRLKKDILALQDCYNGFSDTYDKACIIGVIDEQPTVEERKVGKWIKDSIWTDPYTADELSVFECSVCGNEVIGTGGFDYCPKCGARMVVKHE